MNPLHPSNARLCPGDAQDVSTDSRQPYQREEDAMTETTSRTDDDPVGDAFRKVVDGDGASDSIIDDDDDNDEIVWNLR